MTRIAPNPYSPYANADANTRHLIPNVSLFARPRPGVLAPTGCLRLSVVPEEPLRTVGDDGNAFPPGMCDDCVKAFHAAMAGDDYLDDRPAGECRECDSLTHHDGLCALCRQEKHEEWWPTRNTAKESST